MRIINLVENELGDSGCEAAHGLSFYVETDNHKLLFDSSPSEVVLQNAQKLGVNLATVDTVILSHGHYDHSGGILPFVEINPRAKIYMQQNASRTCNRWFPSYEAYRVLRGRHRRSYRNCKPPKKISIPLCNLPLHRPSSFQSDEKNHGRPAELCAVWG